MKAGKKLPLGITSIEEILQNDYLYVDKTAYIYKLLQGPPAVSLLRPRHFGKSLLSSTISAVFRGEKELFKGCHIYNTDYHWDAHPVIELDFADIRVRNADELSQALLRKFQASAASHKIAMDEDHPMTALLELVKTLAKKAPVVLLVEGYDNPVMDNLDDQERATEIQKELMHILGLIKGLDSSLEFVLMQAECSIALADIFSGLNHLYDISESEKYAALLGYTEEDLLHAFQPHLKELSDKQKRPAEEILTELRLSYNGYRFSSEETSVYNPHGILRFFQKGELASYTEFPAFLKTIIKEQISHCSELGVGSLSHISMAPQVPDSMDLYALMHQTGYYTFRGYNKGCYSIDYPNPLVKREFLTNLFHSITGLPLENPLELGEHLAQSLHTQDWEAFFTKINALLTLTPSAKWKEKEYPRNALFALFQLLLLSSQAQFTSDTSLIDEEGSFHTAFIEKKTISFVQFNLKNSPTKSLKYLQERLSWKNSESKKAFLLEAQIDCQKQQVTSWKLLSC